jgi:hypothetical protein
MPGSDSSPQPANFSKVTHFDRTSGYLRRVKGMLIDGDAAAVVPT